MLDRTLDDRWTGPRTAPGGRSTEPAATWRDRAADAFDLIGHGFRLLGLAGGTDESVPSAPATLLVVTTDGVLLRSEDAARDIMLPSDASDLAATLRTRITDPAHGSTRPFGLAVTDDVALVFELAVAAAPPSRQRVRIMDDAVAESPFGADATLIVHSKLQSPGDDGSVHVALIDRERVDWLVDALADEGLFTDSLTVLDRTTGRIELIGRPDWLPRPAQSWLARWLKLRAALRFTALAVAVVVASMTANLAVSRGKLWVLEAQTADAVAAELSAGRTGADIRRVEALRQDTLALVGVLDALARALPDGTWLDQLEVNEGVVKLGGWAPSAAETLSRVAAVPGLTKVEQSAAVTRDPGAKAEKWRIQATLARGRAP